MTTLTERDVQRIAAEVSRTIVRDLLLTLGVDASDPEAVLKMQADFKHLRDWRTSVDTIKAHGLKTAVGIVVTGSIAAVVAYLKSKGAFS